MHLIVNSVKLTFFQFPHKIEADTDFNNIIKLPSLLNLASMMTYALGGRAKWKDYVDLYFILKNHFSLNQIIDNTDIVFGNFFNAKLLLEQLSFYEDIDNSEPVIYLNEKPSDEKIKTFLTETALNF